MTPTLYDLELERWVLGACLLKPQLLLSLDVSEADFFAGKHQVIWRGLLQLHAEGEPVNTEHLRSKLLDDGKLQAAGGLEYLLDLTDTIPADDLPTERLRRLTRLRGIHTAAQGVLAACAGADIDKAIAALADAHAAALAGASRNRTKSILELCEGLLQELSQPPNPHDLIHPGYELFAEQFGLIPAQSTIGILADTNVGKSSFMLECLIRMAQRNVVVGYLSVEDQERRVRARLASMLTAVSSRKLLQRDLSRDDMAQLSYGFQSIVSLDKHFYASVLQGGTDADVCAAMAELASRGCKVIAVDYLQKIRPSDKRANKAHEMSDICTRITSHGQRLDCVTFLASQCTRDKTRQNECPSKHDMKESGDLENMLDGIIGLWREYEDDFAPTWARILKAKDGGNGKSWCLQRNRKSGRLEEVPDSHLMDPPDARGEWEHRKGRRR